MKTVQKILQKSVKNLIKWSKNTGFNFSREISQCIIFAYKLKNTVLNIKIEHQEIINNNKIKILGITLHTRLLWTQPTNQLKNSIMPRLNTIKVFSHTPWGSKISTLIQIYFSNTIYCLN